MRFSIATIMRAIFLNAALLASIAGSDQSYTGPNCLGPFCMDHTLSSDALFKRLGKPVSTWWGYRSPDGHAFLDVVGEADGDVGGIILSDAPSLKPKDEKLITVTDKEDLSSWKTGEGIGLGSIEEDVRKAYGNPSGETKSVSKKGGAQIETKILIYSGSLGGTARGAEFEIRGGKVSRIELSNLGYSGPACLGITCDGASPPALLKQLESPSQEPRINGGHCYESQDAGAFLYLAAGHEEPPEMNFIFLSDFPNCADGAKQITEYDLHAWKTPEGIGLGSSEEAVVKAYGKPLREEKLNPETCCEHLLVGLFKEEKLPDVGDKRLYYGNRDLQRVEFGIRTGRVSYILLSNGK